MSAALIEQFDLLATSTGGIAKLRELILSLAVRGQLIPQDPADEPASELLKKIRAEKDRLIAEGKIKRDKPLAEIGEDEQPYELPAGWEWVRLSAILPFRIGKTPPTKDDRYWTEGGIPWVSISDMEHLGVVTHTSRTISQAGAEVFSYAPLPAGTLVMSFKLTIGKIAVLGVPAYHNEAIASFLPLGGMGTDFLKWTLPAAAAGGASKDALMGATLNSDSLANLLFALPPLAEQSRIVAKVEELMALCDRLETEQGHAARVQGYWVEAALDQLAESADADEFRRHWQHLAEHFDTLFTTPASIERLNATLLQLAVRGKLVAQDSSDKPASELLKQIRAEKDRLIAEGKIKRDKPLPPLTEDEKPYALQEGWEWARLGTLGLTSTGGTPTTSNAEFFGTDVPFVKPADLRDMEITYQNDGLSFSGAEKVGVIQPESILMVCIGGSIGKLAYSPRLCSCNQQINSITPSVPAMSKTLLFFMAEAGFQSRVKDRAGVGTMPIISKGKWEQLPVPLPPLAEQARIVAQIEMMLALTAELKVRLAAAQTKQAHLGEVLIQEALAV